LRQKVPTGEDRRALLAVRALGSDSPSPGNDTPKTGLPGSVTTDPSMKVMLEPRMVAAKTHGRARSAQPDVSAAARMTPSSQGARPKLIIGCLVASTF
jgi:hypothetical protein